MLSCYLHNIYFSDKSKKKQDSSVKDRSGSQLSSTGTGGGGGLFDEEDEDDLFQSITARAPNKKKGKGKHLKVITYFDRVFFNAAHSNGLVKTELLKFRVIAISLRDSLHASNMLNGTKSE